MKIAFMSDVHLEFGPCPVYNPEGAKILVLAGDICVAADLFDKDGKDIPENHRGETKHMMGLINAAFHSFFQQCCVQFEQVIYTAGNHEHYHGDFTKTYGILRDRLAYLPNLHILDKQTLEIDGITFVAGTMWTDLHNNDWFVKQKVKQDMNDFYLIKNSKYMKKHVVDGMETVEMIPSTFQPEDTIEDHREFLAVLEETIKDKFDKKFVVVSHHAPSYASVDKQYTGHRDNPAYATELSEMILDNPQIKLWIHGHMHHINDYMIGETRIASNPRGYVKYEVTGEGYIPMVVEING